VASLPEVQQGKREAIERLVSTYIPPVCNMCENAILIPLGREGLGMLYKCPSCQAIHKGFHDAHIPDPTIQRREDGRSKNCPWKMKPDAWRKDS